ncbi:MAG: hypothetical protein K2Q01_05125, partial [Rickettsiales bacterium]|nr:hypothetical protein [Rickettsiales bacterium]
MQNSDHFPKDFSKLRLDPDPKTRMPRVTDGERYWFIKNLPERELAMTMKASAADLGPDAITRIAKAMPIHDDMLPPEVRDKVHGAWECTMVLLEAMPNQHGMFKLTEYAV